MTEDITRLKIVASCDWKGFAYAHTETDDDGDYVTFEDAVAALATKDSEIERLRSALQNIIREDDTGPMTFEIRANGPAQAIGGSEGKFAAIARAALNGGSDAP